MDNGTSAWGKPPGGVGGWGDSGHEPSGPYGRANGPPVSAPCKPGNIHQQTVFSVMPPQELSIYQDAGLCRKFLQPTVPFVQIQKIFVCATVVLQGLKQFHASVGRAYLCCLLAMREGGVGKRVFSQMATVAPSGHVKNYPLLTSNAFSLCF